MRTSFILPVVIAAILHAAGYALPTTKDSVQATITNPGIDVADGGSLLRRVNKGDELVQEERSNPVTEFAKKFGKKLGTSGKKFGKCFVNDGDYRVRYVGGRSWI